MRADEQAAGSALTHQTTAAVKPSWETSFVFSPSHERCGVVQPTGTALGAARHDLCPGCLLGRRDRPDGRGAAADEGVDRVLLRDAGEVGVEAPGHFRRVMAQAVIHVGEIVLIGALQGSRVPADALGLVENLAVGSVVIYYQHATVLQNGLIYGQMRLYIIGAGFFRRFTD